MVKKKKRDIDRISELPDPLLCHILSSIKMLDVVRTSLLSKRWRHIWKFVPKLLLADDEQFGQEDDVINKNFQKFVQGVLLYRDDGSPIHTLHLSTPIPENAIEDPGQLKSWISYALRQHVRKIHLEDVQYIRLSTINLGCQVKILKLTNVSLPCSKTSGELHLKSPVLEKLIVQGCYQRALRLLRISAPRLKLLMVDNGYDTDNCGSTFELDAPMLQSLHLIGDIYLDYTLGDLSQLDTAHIDTYLYDLYQERDPTGLNNLLSGLVYAKSLTLEVIQDGYYKSKSTSKFQWTPITYHNLKVLKLIRWRGDGYFGPIAKLLASFPCVETLILEDPKKFFMLKEGEHSSSKCMLDHLKSVEVRYPNSDMHEDLMKLFSFLMGKGVVLEKIIVKVAKWEKGEEWLEFCKILRSLPVVPSRVTVALILKRWTMVFKDSGVHQLLVPTVHGVDSCAR